MSKSCVRRSGFWRVVLLSVLTTPVAAALQACGSSGSALSGNATSHSQTLSAAVTQNGYTVSSASASPASVSPGQTLVLNASISSSKAASNMIFDMEIYNSSGTQVALQYYTGVNFSAGQTVSESWNYAVPSSLAAGTYTLEIGVFNSSWSSNPMWDGSAATFTVTSQPSFSVSPASANPVVVIPGETVTLSAPVRDSGAAEGDMIVDLAIYNSSGTMVAQQYYTGVNFVAGQTVTESWSYAVPSSAADGTYSLSVGVFNSNWETEYLWTGNVVSYVVSSASASGTTIPSASQIVDSLGNIWTVSGGVVLENGADAGYTANVIELLYYNGVIYQENSSDLWWSWSGSAWVSSSNPATSSGGSSGSGSGSGSGSSSPVSMGIAVNGDKFINTATGQTVVLAGANLDGLDGSGGYGGAGQIQQWNMIAGITTAQWKAIAAQWGINCLRLPMNDAYWLNPTVHDDPANIAIGDLGLGMYTQIGTNEYTPDASGTYKSVFQTVVANITAAGIVVVLDLHQDTPQNSSGQYIAGVGETSLPSVSTTGPFWTSVATAFKSNPMVIFGLFNEPFGSTNYNSAGSPPAAVSGGGASATPGSSAITMIAGGSFAPFSMLSDDTTMVTINGGAPIQALGMINLIDMIRDTGATNVIIAPPIWYSGQIQTWLDSYTTAEYGRTSSGNPDPIGQLAADWHDYGWSSGTAAPLGILAAGYPILMSETYGFDSALDGGSNASGYSWAAQNDIGVLLWAWATWGSGGASTSTEFYNYLLSTGPWVMGGAPAPTGNTFGQSPL